MLGQMTVGLVMVGALAIEVWRRSERVHPLRLALTQFTLRWIASLGLWLTALITETLLESGAVDVGAVPLVITLVKMALFIGATTAIWALLLFAGQVLQMEVSED